MGMHAHATNCLLYLYNWALWFLPHRQSDSSRATSKSNKGVCGNLLRVENKQGKVGRLASECLEIFTGILSKMKVFTVTPIVPSSHQNCKAIENPQT